MITIDKIDNFPTAPGVYLMKSGDETVLYVGKARDLRKRVRSYFSASRDSRQHIHFLMLKVAKIDFIVTDTEKEALILENTLIKQYRPRYNINLRDDKTYFSLRMDMTEEFPRLSIIRRVVRDGARYFGPYASATAAKEVLKQLSKIFPLRHYPLETCRQRKRPCLFYQIKQCSAPCHGLISARDYAALAEGAALFLEGKNRAVVKIFREKMIEAAAAAHYEAAARFRDLIRDIEITVERQKMVDQGGDSDIFGLFRDGEQLNIATLFVRNGTLTGSRNYSFLWELGDPEGLASFLNEYYCRDVFIPATILLPLSIDEPAALEELLTEKSGNIVRLFVPRRGRKLEMVRLAAKNAESSALEKRKRSETEQGVLEELRDHLHLSGIPHRIECYDISNIQGKIAVGSRVVFRDGRPDRQSYRRYRIKDVDQADDFAMMREVLARRFRARGGDDDRPDLIVVDGGIGQLNVLTGVLAELHIEGVAAAGLAKSRVTSDMRGETLARSGERVFLPGRKNPLPLKQHSAPLLLLARIRDEAHRFAVTYHQNLRSKGLLASELESVPGIGSVLKKALLRKFGSLSRLKEATREELQEVHGVSRQKAEAVWKNFHSAGQRDEG
jgi:excinuclease ABC subunit C